MKESPSASNDRTSTAARGDAGRPPSPTTASLDVVDEIWRFNVGREPERLAFKYRAMRKDAFSFLRGTAHLFNRRLAQSPLPIATPAVWVCGDIHLENFGAFDGTDGHIHFDINDFDESALAPAGWDLVRLGTSLLVAGDALGATPQAARELCGACFGAYTEALAAGRAGSLGRDNACKAVADLLDAVDHRSRLDWLDGRTEVVGSERRIRLDGKRSLPADAAQRAFVTGLVDAFAAGTGETAALRVLDVARRVAGTGSLGVERYVVLVEGQGSPDRNGLLDLKEATASTVAVELASRQPRWASEAQRVVTLQRRLQGTSPAMLHDLAGSPRSHVLRALQPTEDKIQLGSKGVSAAAMAGLVVDMGKLLAWAHLRGSGQQGAAAIDELRAAGPAITQAKAALVRAAGACATQVVADWNAYRTACNAGTFGARRYPDGAGGEVQIRTNLGGSPPPAGC